MEVDIFAAMSSAAATLFEPTMLFYMVLGVGIGTLLAVVPGVGGLMGIALLLPFTFAMSAQEAIVFLLGALAVMSTADTIPAVLFGVPGTPTSMVTVLDGNPMAKRGEAGRALGAAFTSSVLGGVIGALALLLVIPVVMPILMGTTSPELLALCLLGLAMVAALSGGSMLKGLGAACIGVLLAFIGQDAVTATPRWTFDALYLYDGFHILIIALGIYAIPEVIDMAIVGKSIAAENKGRQMKGAMQGLGDTLRNWWLVLRSAVFSTVMGVVPAIGPTVIPWIIYSYTTMSTKGPSNFGKGDVRGVIASESSNNATVGGALLPTVAVGVPGSAPMALLLAAMLMHGVAPGPDMLSRNLDFTYMMVWAIVLANLIGGVMAFGLAGQLAKVIFVRPSILVPLITTVVVVGAVQSSRQWEDLLFLVLIGALGWVMKHARWSRAPMFLAFILAPLVEKYFHISMNIHGWGWTTRPAVMVMLAITFAFLGVVAYKRVRRAFKAVERRPRGFHITWSLESLFAIVVLVCAGAALWALQDWPRGARLLPEISAWLTLGLAFGSLMTAWRKPIGATAAEARSRGEVPGSNTEDVHYDLETDFGDLSPRQILLRAVRYLALLGAFGLVAWGIGIVTAAPLFILAYMLVHGERFKIALIIAVCAGLIGDILFERFLELAWPYSEWAFGLDPVMEPLANWVRDLF